MGHFFITLSTSSFAIAYGEKWRFTIRSTDNMVYDSDRDILVFTSRAWGTIHIIDAITGHTLHMEFPKENSKYLTDVVYDQGRDLYFTSSDDEVVCFRLNGL